MCMQLCHAIVHVRDKHDEGSNSDSEYISSEEAGAAVAVIAAVAAVVVAVSVFARKALTGTRSGRMRSAYDTTNVYGQGSCSEQQPMGASFSVPSIEWQGTSDLELISRLSLSGFWQTSAI